MNTKRLRYVFSNDFGRNADIVLSIVTEQFINQYYYYLVKFIELENDKSLKNTEDCLSNDYTEVTRKYLNWFERQGSKVLESIIEHLNKDNINENAMNFYKYYSFMLGEAFEQKNEDLLLDYLYCIPEIMRAEYNTFGFVTAL